MMRRYNHLGLVGLISILSLCLLVSVSCNAKVTLKLLLGNWNPESVQGAVREFEKENPEIAVSITNMAWYELNTKFLTMLAAGDPPDVVINVQGHLSGWPRYAIEGVLMDLEPYVERDKKEIGFDDFWPEGWRDATIRGRLVGVPLTVGLGSCVNYNATLLDEAGLELPPLDWEDKSWNWDRMVQYAKKLTKVTADGKATQFGVDFWHADMLYIIWPFGGDWFDKLTYTNGLVNKATIYTPENVRACQAIADLMWKHRVKPRGPLTFDSSISEWDAWRNGKIAMWIDTIGFMDVKGFKWGWAPLPYVAGGSRDRASSYFDVMGIPKGSKHPEEAWKLIKFLVSPKATYIVTDPNSPSRGQSVYWAGIGSKRSFCFEYINTWMKLGCSALPARQVQQFVSETANRFVALPKVTVVGYNEVWQSGGPVPNEVDSALAGKISVDEALQRAQRIADEAVRKVKEQLKL